MFFYYLKYLNFLKKSISILLGLLFMFNLGLITLIENLFLFGIIYGIFINDSLFELSDVLLLDLNILLLFLFR